MSQEQQQLVSVIRGVHEKLRFDYQSTGDEERVWEGHCRDAELRKRYADSMLRLATTIWPFRDRIEWCHQTLRNYFYEGGLKRALRSLPSFDQNAESAMEHALRLLQLPPGGKVRLLDVGSCYDPFRCYEDIEAVAVDLTPAREGVLQCDFLKLRVTDPSGGRWSPYVLTDPLVELPAASFQAVVLCMVLEYLPSCLQRWTFCRKAAALLRPYGLLLVVTPDSKHQQRNAAMVASWREALGNLGLPKLRYEKRQHLHCMAFYRCGPVRELSEGEEVAEARKMYIPQDSRDYVALFSRVGVEERDEAADVALGEGFSELPDCVDL